jgi:hypothetical protein
MRASPAQGATVRGRVLQCVPPRHLSITWGYEDDAHGMPAGSTVVDISLEPIATGTRVVLVHSGFPSADTAAQHSSGWLAYLSALANQASRIQNAAAAARSIRDYFAAWAEPDGDKRSRHLEVCWSERGRFADQFASLSGRPSLCAWIGTAQKMSPGLSLALSGEPQFCQGTVLFRWDMKAGDQIVGAGVNVGEVDLEGRITSLTGFWGG